MLSPIIEKYIDDENKPEPPKTLDNMFPVIPKEFKLPQGPLIIPQKIPNYVTNN